MIWDAAATERLKMLWEAGFSAAEIGRQMGCTKNAVIGKAGRIGCAHRPSPIVRVQDRPAPAAIDAALDRPFTPDPAPKPVAPKKPRVVAPPARVDPPIRREPPMRTCFWPLGEPGTKTFRFCDAVSMPGKPYCEAHARMAVVRIRERVG